MDFDEAIRGRRSIRQFTTEGVDETVIGKLIDAAILAPSAVNEQPWSFYICRRRDHLDAINKGVKAQLLRSSAAAVTFGAFRQTLMDAASDVFHGAPALIVIASHADSAWAVEDCALAAQNLMLAAYAMDLGSCWIGSARDFLRTNEGRAMLGLQTDHLAVAPIIVGHPLGTPPAPKRAPADIHWVS